MADAQPPEPVRKLANRWPQRRVSEQDLVGYLNETATWIRKTRYRLFKKFKDYEDETIGEEIYLEITKFSGLGSYYRIALAAVERTLARQAGYLASISTTGSEATDDELSFLSDLAFDSVLAVDHATEVITGDPAGFGWFARGKMVSTESFAASQSLLRGFLRHGSLADFAARPTAAFLLRQAVELRILRALGVAYVRDLDRGVIRVPGIHFLDLLLDKQNVVFPMKSSILRKIHKWTNFAIHGGLVPEAWKIEWAHHLLLPLFQPAVAKTRGSLHGSIRIQRDYYDRVEETIKQRILQHRCSSDADKLVIERCEPEADLVDR